MIIMVKNKPKFLHPHHHCDNLISSVPQNGFTSGAGGHMQGQ